MGLEQAAGDPGGWVPLTFGGMIFISMLTWRRGVGLLREQLAKLTEKPEPGRSRFDFTKGIAQETSFCEQKEAKKLYDSGTEGEATAESHRHA